MTFSTNKEKLQKSVSIYDRVNYTFYHSTFKPFVAIVAVTYSGTSAQPFGSSWYFYFEFGHPLLHYIAISQLDVHFYVSFSFPRKCEEWAKSNILNGISTSQREQNTKALSESKNYTIFISNM